MEVKLINHFNKFIFKNIDKFLETGKYLKLDLEIIFINIVSKEDILELNKKYLNHNYYTDILTFDLRDNISKDSEIFICYSVAEENSRFLNIDIETEMTRLVIHGLLHLANYNDKNEKEKSEMTKMENFFLQHLFHVKTDEK
ncbi:MAG: rRNA maturation RNase YbeY [Bacteroidia bacterium]|nr:rRNA maturation RNase YbeY [Bacteroidia bacterium]